MQDKRDLETLSRLRQDLRRLLSELKRHVEVVFGRGALIKGNVYEMARKCGKLSCACTRGQLHRSMVLSWSAHGKTRIMSVPLEQLSALRKKSEEYLSVRRARARVSVIYKEILSVMDQIEKLRLEEP